MKAGEYFMSQITVVGMFDSYEQAEKAAEALRQKGISDVRLAAPTAKSEPDPESSTITTLFQNEGIPGVAQRCYLEALNRGLSVVKAHLDDSQSDDAVDILEASGAVDIEERARIWRDSGWNAESANEIAASLTESLARRSRYSRMQTGRRSGYKAFVW
jgi:hypothetical protein